MNYYHGVEVMCVPVWNLKEMSVKIRCFPVYLINLSNLSI